MHDTKFLEFQGNERFQVVERLGQGGMGVVYEVYDRERQVRVALKTLLRGSADALLLFKQEFRALQDLRHPNLVKLGELFEDRGQWFFTMELVEGESFVRYVCPVTSNLVDTGSSSNRGQSSGLRNKLPPGASSTDRELRSDSGQRAAEPSDSSAGSGSGTGSDSDPGFGPATQTSTASAVNSAPATATSTVDAPGNKTLSAALDSPALLVAKSGVVSIAEGTDVIAGSDVTVAGASVPPIPRHLRSCSYDENRLRAALAQLAHALCFLHAAGKVHRDIKPSNILVTPDDRIVLLDFGIVKDLDQIEQWGDQSASGTAAYMAPEQARPGMATPAADWYCVGVMLYQCMTGLLPFSGRPGAVLALKERRDPIPPSQLVSGVSPDLERLCLDLMRREPSARPSGEEVLQRLKAELSPADLGPSQRNVFVGRAEELKQLIRAFEDSQSSGGLSAVVIGDSGVGKSFLIRRFVRELRAMRPELVLLAGRCYERESVPYKAVDGIIDQLSQYLQHLPEERAQALLPAQVSLLATLFPVLEPLGALAPQAVASTADALELRSRAFLLLRELLTRLGQDVPLVLLIDDLQWADNDSFALLAEILRPPAPRLLLLATSRKPLSSDAKISSASLVGEVRTIHLEPMTSEESQELAARLLGRRAAREMAAAIAREAGGHPLFIDELVRHQRDAGREGKADLAVRIDQALWQRVTRLQDGPRQLVELLAIAGKPITQALAAQASALGPYALDDAAASLRTSHLARTSGVRLHDTIEPFHDLVREAILANLTADKRRSWHGRLATALETVEVPDAEHLFLHWRGAGQNERAGTYAIKAADQAAASLAFEHASKLYQQALDLLPKLPPEERRALHRKLGQALANAGRGEPAARAYLKATEQATATEQRDLTCKAAEQLMRSGHLDEGTQYLRQVLKSVGLSYPATPLRALFALLLRRIQLTLRGLGYQERSAASISVDVRGQLDVCWAAACGLAMADIIRGAVFQAHYLILALRAGDPLCISRGLAQEAAFRAGAGLPGWKQTEKVLHAAESLGRKIQDQYSLSSVHMSRGLAYHLSGRFRESDEQLLKGEALLREQFICNGWEMDNCKLFLCFNDIYLGEFRRMSERLPRFIEEAEARGDLFSLTNYAVCPLPMSLLVQDQPDRAEQVATDSLTKWSHDGFHLEHYNAMQVQTQIDLYRQQGVAAHKRVLALLPKAKAALLLEVQNPRIEIQDLIGCSAVAAAIEQPAQADKYLKAAERAARRLSREKAAWALALALRIRACIAAVRKEREQARALFEQAAAALAAVDMAMYAAAARLRWGELEGGAAGAQRIAQAEQSMREQGILSPSRFTAFLAPAL